MLKILLFFLIYLNYAFAEMTIKSGYLSEFYSNLKYENSKSALKIFIKDVAKEAGLDLHLSIYKNEEKFLNDYVNNKIDIMVINPYLYLENKEIIDKNTIQIWDFKKSFDKDFVKYYLVVNNKSGIKTINDLKNKKIAIDKNKLLAKAFLEKEFYEKNKRSSKAITTNIKVVEKGSVLLKTYFGQYDACIIDSEDYDTMYDLNPAILKRLTIIKKSDAIFSDHLIFFHKNQGLEKMKMHKETLKRFMNDPRQNNVFELLKTKKLEIIKLKDLDELNSFYNEYKILKKKYK